MPESNERGPCRVIQVRECVRGWRGRETRFETQASLCASGGGCRRDAARSCACVRGFGRRVGAGTASAETWREPGFPTGESDITSNGSYVASTEPGLAAARYHLASAAIADAWKRARPTWRTDCCADGPSACADVTADDWPFRLRGEHARRLPARKRGTGEVRRPGARSALRRGTRSPSCRRSGAARPGGPRVPPGLRGPGRAARLPLRPRPVPPPILEQAYDLSYLSQTRRRRRHGGDHRRIR